MPDKTFLVYGKSIVVSSDYDAYNTLRLQCTQRADRAAQIFGKRYNEYGNIDNVVNNAFNDGLSIIMKVIDELVINGVLMNLKIYDIDMERFFREFYQDKYFLWGNAFDEVQDQYMAIRLEQKQLDEFRTMRRQNCARWVGGGFGIRGAIKGAVKAGALNMDEEVLYEFIDSREKAKDVENENNQKSALYKNSATKNTLVNGIWKSVYQIHFAVWSMLEERAGRMRVDCLVPGVEKKAGATVNNFVRMPKEEVLAIFPQILLMNPYNEELYKRLFSIFGDPGGGLQKTAQYFGIDTSFITAGKERLADKIFAEIKRELGQSEQAALDAKAKYELALKSNGVDDTVSAKRNLKALMDYAENEKTKAIPGFNELVSSWEKYKTGRTEGALNHINELLQKMPTRIRKGYWGLLSEFETEQRKTLAVSRITLRWPLVILGYAVAAILFVLTFLTEFRTTWEWVGLKGIAVVFMFVLPAVMIKTFSNNAADRRILVQLARSYWAFAFLTFVSCEIKGMNESGDAVTGSRSFLIISLLISLLLGALVVGDSVLGAIKCVSKSRELGKAAEYLKDFEQLSSQSKEYRNFKMTKTK